jgi:TatD DNase family protein
MTLELFDTHAHLQQREFNKDRSAAVERAREAGLIGILVLGVDAETSEQALNIATGHEGVSAAAGCHPHDAKDMSADGWETIDRLARDSRIVAIGEIGLDFYRDLSPRDVQVTVLERQLELAREVSKPVAVHCREASETLFPILESWSRSMDASLPDGRPLGLMHYFSGDVDLAHQFVELGFLISIHTSVTYTNASRLQQVAAELPLDTLVVETDSPYGAPQTKRGKRNEPANVREAVEKITELRNEPIDSVARATTANALRAFAPAPKPAGVEWSAAR